MTRKILVGSTNPVKISATKKAAELIWNDVEIISIQVPSLVSKMPLSKEEMRIGARNRAENALKRVEGWIGIGHEGGICNISGKWYLSGSTFATDGRKGAYGGETLLQLPENIIGRLEYGEIELGHVMDDLTGDHNTKQKEGAIGYLTNNLITRVDIFENASIMALSPWSEEYNKFVK